MLKIAKRKNSSLVGLEIEAGSIAAVEIQNNGSARMTAAAIAPLAFEAFEDGEVTDSETLATALRALFAEHGLVESGPTRNRQSTRRRAHPAAPGDRGSQGA